jgi:hypothetical protein
VAMNARGQRETGGALGAFCVRCHAPLALARGATRDGLDLGALPAELRGVTCVVCHTSSASPAGLAVADDGVMRGPLSDPLPSPAHASAYSAQHDRDHAESADLCGACHAVTNLHGVEVERTIDEWRATSYARAPDLRTCGRCHMAETTGVAADVPGAPSRPVHAHAMPAIDWNAGSADEQTLVQRFLDPSIDARLCVVPGDGGAEVTVTVENALVGHAWPSGATQDRRAWLEIVGYRQGAMIYASGVVVDGVSLDASPVPPLLVWRERLSDELGAPTAFLWNAWSAQADLLAPATADPENAVRSATVVLDAAVDRVTSRVRVRALDHDVADALVASGDLAPGVAAALPTLTVRATVLEWTADRGAACLP